MAEIVEETSKVTAKGQTTVPKSVRRVLGVDYGGRIAFRIEGGRVTVLGGPAQHGFVDGEFYGRDVCVLAAEHGSSEAATTV